MRSVLVVDDEKWIREGIKSKLKKYGFSIDAIGEAENGTKAINLMKEHPYDIVISDICMNDMDGLKLCEILSRDFPKTQKIILSGYGEFDYAAKAIHEGVIDYLLKPIDYEDLVQALRRCEQRLKQEENKYDMQFHSVLEQIYLVSENYKDILQDEKSFSRLFSKYSKGKTLFGCLYFYLGGWTEQSPSQILTLIRQSCGNYEFGESLFLLKTSNFEYAALVIIPSEWSLPHQRKELRLLAERIADRMEHQGTPEISCGISDVSPQPLLSIQKAEHYLKYRILLPDSIFLDSENTYSFRQSYQLPESDRLSCLFAIRAGNYRDFSAILHRVEKKAVESQICYEDLEQLYQGIWSLVSENTDPIEGAETVRGKLFWQYSSVSSAFKALREFGLSRINISNSDEKNFRYFLVHQVREYIETHYAEQISLEQLAEQNFVTSSYLSAAFKEEIGVNFLDYLNGIRLDVAKKLMAEQRYKIKTIAAMTGFNDQHYFSRAFKKREGCTPKEFIDSLS